MIYAWKNISWSGQIVYVSNLLLIPLDWWYVLDISGLLFCTLPNPNFTAVCIDKIKCIYLILCHHDKMYGLLVKCKKIRSLVSMRYETNAVVSNHVNSDHVLDVWTPWETTSGVYAITVTTSAYHSRRCGRL